MKYSILMSRDLHVLLYVDEKQIVHETFDEDLLLWCQVKYPWALKYGEAACISKEQIQLITHGIMPFEPHTSQRPQPSYDVIRQYLAAKIKEAEINHHYEDVSKLREILSEIETDDETIKAGIDVINEEIVSD